VHLTPGWSVHLTPEGAEYFVDLALGAAQFAHPCDEGYREAARAARAAAAAAAAAVAVAVAVATGDGPA
jgi:hypothetical protein